MSQTPTATTCAYCADDEKPLYDFDGDPTCSDCAAEEMWQRSHTDAQCEDGRSLDYDYECTRDHREEHSEAVQLNAWELATRR